MLDSHFHLWTQDESTPEKRAERAEQIIEQMEAMGVDRICLIGEVGNTLEACREANRTVAKYVEEYPDRFYGWARVDPRLGEDAVGEFRRAVEEDGLVGLKHHCWTTPVNITDSEFFPLAEAAIDMDVPVISHVMQRLEADKENWDDSEAYTEDVLELARRYPDLKLISAHIVAGGDPEYRIKNVAHQENVYLDISGSHCETGAVEMAAERCGVDRLVFGTDTWFASGVGKLEGVDLAPEEKAEIAYNFEGLLADNVPNRFEADELAARKAAAVERFERVAEPREEEIVDVNAFVGSYPFRRVDGSPNALLERMDSKGVDRAFVSAFESILYRNPQAGNEELRDAVAGREDRLVPFATIDPTYTAWREDLTTCVEDWGFRGVKLLPLYHDYDLDDEAAVALLDACADLGVPVVIAGVLEDQRQRWSRMTLRGLEDGSARAFSDEHVDQLIDLLLASPEADVILGDLWASAERVYEAVCTVQKSGVRLDNAVRSGETLFILNDLYIYFTHQAETIGETLGPDHLVTGPRLPLKIFESTYGFVDLLPFESEGRRQVRSANASSLVN